MLSLYTQLMVLFRCMLLRKWCCYYIEFHLYITVATQQTWFNYDGHHLKYASYRISIVTISLIVSSKGDYVHILFFHSANSKRIISESIYKKKLLKIIKIYALYIDRFRFALRLYFYWYEIKYNYNIVHKFEYKIT